MENFWEDLPKEIQQEIIVSLNLFELLKCRLICKNFQVLIDDDSIWKKHVKQISGTGSLPSQYSNWKELFIYYYQNFSWDSVKKGPHINLEGCERTAVSLNTGGWAGDRITNFYWQTVLSKIHVTPSCNVVEVFVQEFDKVLLNTRGIMIGVDLEDKIQITEKESPCWIGLDSGWGYAAKSGELFVPGSRSNHASKLFARSYGKGDVVGVLVDFEENELAFFVNYKLAGIESIVGHTQNLSKLKWAFAAAHGNTRVDLKLPYNRDMYIEEYKKNKHKIIK